MPTQQISPIRPFYYGQKSAKSSAKTGTCQRRFFVVDFKKAMQMTCETALVSMKFRWYAS